ncbi:MAG: lysine--tRNA ligase [Candidatus Colwellbacteria bacterium]|nr:lysine--tRNA ligase [Candidatus Colwellbacteria bacterium]
MKSDELSERESRIKKREELIKAGVNPYPYSFARTHEVADIVANQKQFVENQENVSVCGKVYAVREHGGSIFYTLADESGKIQLYAKRDDLGEKKFDLLKDYIGIGDFLGAEGEVFYTKKGELSVKLKSFELLAKALMPLPSEWYGIKDTEKRFRQRYLDILLNEDVKDRFIKRVKIVDAIRGFLREKKFLELETPILQPIYGGARAKPFTTRYESLKRDFYLRISDELYLKRALIANFERVFEFSRDFRNEGIDASHNPEFTMIEIYQAYVDYEYVMASTRELLLEANLAAGNGEKIKWGDKEINLNGKWPTATMGDLLKKHTGEDLINASQEELAKYARKEKLDVPKKASWGMLVDEIFKDKVEPHLVDPIFVVDYPLDISPLAKTHRKNEKLTERFELYIGGKEIANGFSELNDPVEQRRRWEMERKNLKSGDEEAHPMDEDFLLAQEYGMPPAGGVGIGIDRLVMLLTNATNIREVIMFPQLKTKEK